MLNVAEHTQLSSSLTLKLELGLHHLQAPVRDLLLLFKEPVGLRVQPVAMLCTQAKEVMMPQTNKLTHKKKKKKKKKKKPPQ